MRSTFDADSEFMLLAAATAHPPTARDTAAIAGAVDGRAIDWTRFQALVERHRVAPLAFAGLGAVAASIPEPVLAALRRIAVREQANSLRLAGLLTTVIARLATAGIDAASIKGPTLAVLAFGDPTLRQMRDLDILVARDDAIRACAVLKDMGCRLVYPAGFDHPDRFRLWSRFKKDLTLLHEPTGATIELHWRLNDNPYLMPASIEQSRQTVVLGDASIQTLARDGLLLYLSLHGAKHAWFRLKWLADIRALLAEYSTSQLYDFWERAKCQGLNISVDQMFALLNAVYDEDVPSTAYLKIRRARYLFRIAQQHLLDIDESKANVLTMIRNFVPRLLLGRGWRYLIQDAVDVAIDWPTVIRLKGARGAVALSVLLRPALWGLRRVGRAVRNWAEARKEKIVGVTGDG